MKCEEFWRIVDHKKPRDVTRAERAAVIRHVKTCATCRKGLDKYRAILTPENARMLREDFTDPEFRKVLRGNKP